MKYRVMALVFLFLLLNAPSMAAQTDDCAAPREAALQTATQSCANQGPDTLCFGHETVSSVMNCENAPDFSTPGDTIPLQAICALRLNGLQPDGPWGIASMQVPTAQGSDLALVLLGDLEIQNAASATTQLRVWTDEDLTIHAGPGRPFEILATVPPGEVLLVNACNCTRHWYRTILEDQRVGWLFSGDVTVLGEETGLPVVNPDTPIYAHMQAFEFTSGQQSATCAETATAGIFIQSPASSTTAALLRINGAEIALNGTVFAESQPGTALTFRVLDGEIGVTANQFRVTAPAGTHVIVPLSDENLPDAGMSVMPSQAEDVAHLPVGLLPVPIDPARALNNPVPQIVGLEPCVVVSNHDNALCRLHFVNADGDALPRMNVTFVDAPQGEWTGEVLEPPRIIEGDQVGGQIAWEPSCTLGAANFIGPVRWTITLTDEQGHTSLPFDASFNCVDG